MPVMWRGPGAAVKKGLRICLAHLFGLMKRPRGTINATGDNTEETTIDLRGLPALRTRKPRRACKLARPWWPNARIRLPKSTFGT